MTTNTKTIELPKHMEAWGFIPMMITPNSKLPLWEQIDRNYAHGGGWHDFDKFDVSQDEEGAYSLTYPGDPALVERDRLTIGDEMLVLFPYSWILYVGMNGDKGVTKVARID